MAFFEELGKKITQTSQDVVQKTKDTAEVLKLNSMISDEEKIINNFYSEVGKMYFELHAHSYEPELKDMIIGIKEAKHRIDEYNEQIKKLKRTERCPNCGGDIQCGAPFCSSCGIQLEVHNDLGMGSSSNAKRCPACGALIAAEYAFCTYCGIKVEEQKPEVAEPVIEQTSPKVCPNCDNKVTDDSAFCTNCGTKL